MTPLTVFHIDGERTLRGGERQVLYLAEGLRRRGHRNVLACRKGSALDRAARDAGFETLHLAFLNEVCPLSVLKLRRAALAADRPLLHAHTAHAASLAALAAAGSGLRRVVHRRVDFPPGGGLSLALKYKGADKVLAVSHFVARQLIEAGVPEGKVVTVHSAFDAAAAQPPRDRPALRARLARELELDPEGPWIGNLAAFVPHKDHETLIRGFALLRREHPKAVLLLAGEGPLKAPMEALAAGLGLGRSVRFLGQRGDPHELCGAFDVYVQSSWGEGLGSVVLEAMACGTPVAAARAGGLPEMVLDGQTGLLFEPRSPAGLATALCHLLASPGLAAGLALKARGRLDAFSPARMTELTEAVYAEVFQEAHAA